MIHPTTLGLRPAIEIYDPTAGTFTTRSSMPSARMNPSVVKTNGWIAVTGGDNNAYCTIGCPEVFAYNPTSDAWVTLSSLQSGRAEHTSFVWNSALYVIGGKTSAGAGTPISEKLNLSNLFWQQEGNLNIGRAEHTLTLLQNGKY